MKFLTTLTTIFISFISSGGLILDTILTNFLRSYTQNIEQLEIRVNNLPSYKILQGQAKTIKIASRGLTFKENVRIETLEIETDAVNINLQNLKKGNINNWRQTLKEPLQGGLRLVLTETDINETLQSAQIQSYLENLLNNSRNFNFEIINAHLNLIANNRIKLETQIKLLNQGAEETLNITLEFGLEVIKGHKIKIVEPMGTLNGRQLSKKLLQGFADNINFDCQSLETYGIILRILELEINDNEIKLAAFGRLTNNN